MPRRLATRMDAIEPSFIREILAVTARPEVISFAGGLPGPGTFPVEEIRSATEAALGDEARRTLQYTETQGDPDLRALIADRYRVRFGWDVDPERIIVLNGSQQALDLLGKVLLDPGDRVVVEEPSYLGALQGLRFFEPEFRPVPLVADGIDTARLAEELPSAALAYTVPVFQNPTGTSYSAATREEVARLVVAGDTVLVEDDPYGELRFRGTPPDPIARHADEQTVLLGSFSKTVAPGLRMGWMVVPEWLRQPLLVAKQAADLHSNHLSQRTLVHLLGSLDHDRHLAGINTTYEARLRAMEAAIDELLPGVERTRPDGGMFLWLTLPVGSTAREVLDEAMARDVVFVPGDAFSASGGSERSLRVSFVTVDPDRIRDGVERLAEAVDAARPSIPTSPYPSSP